MISCSVTVTTPLRLACRTGHTTSPTLILREREGDGGGGDASPAHLRASAMVLGGDSFTSLFPAANDLAMSSAFFGSAATTFTPGLMLCGRVREGEGEAADLGCNTQASYHAPHTNTPHNHIQVRNLATRERVHLRLHTLKTQLTLSPAPVVQLPWFPGQP